MPKRLVLHIDTQECALLGLTGNEVLVYYALRYLSSRRPYKGSMEDLAKLALCSRETCRRTVEKLIEKGLVSKDETGLFSAQNEQCAAQNEQNNAQNVQNLKRKEPKEKNIIKEIKVCPSNDIKTASTDGRTDFLIFWNTFKPKGEFKKRFSACKILWNKMPESWRQLALKKAVPEKRGDQENPYFYLQDEEFWLETNPQTSIHHSSIHHSSPLPPIPWIPQESIPLIEEPIVFATLRGTLCYKAITLREYPKFADRLQISADSAKRYHLK